MDRDHDQELAGRHRFLPALLVSLLITGVIGGTAWLYMMERSAGAPLRASDQFIHAMLSKDIDTAYALTSPTFQAATSRQEFESVADVASAELDRSTLRVSAGDIEESESARTATLTYYIEGGGQKYQMTVKVIQRIDEEDDRWLILSVTNSQADAS